MSYGNSKKWIAPGVREKQRHEKLNQLRAKVCKNSPFWHANFDIETHKREWSALHQARLDSLGSGSSCSGSPRSHPEHFDLLSTPSTHHASIPETPLTSVSSISQAAFSGKIDGESIEDNTTTTFLSNLSPVLCLPTIFTPNFKLGKAFVAPWPNKSEMKYEGDDRIATDKIHRRFLGAPRVEGNETVNWQHRNVIKQHPLENYDNIYSEHEVLMRTHHLPILEADYECIEEAWHLLGRELYELLDPVDRL